MVFGFPSNKNEQFDVLRQFFKKVITTYTQKRFVD